MTRGQSESFSVAAVEEFFRSYRYATLRLPSGWYGRPYDNLHALSEVRVDGESIVIMLDDVLTIRVHPSGQAVAGGRVLRLPIHDGVLEMSPLHRPSQTMRIEAGAVEFYA